MDYPLVNVYISMENHSFWMGKLTLSMAIFNSHVTNSQRLDPIQFHGKPSFSHGFSYSVFMCFSSTHLWPVMFAHVRSPRVLRRIPSGGRVLWVRLESPCEGTWLGDHGKNTQRCRAGKIIGLNLANHRIYSELLYSIYTFIVINTWFIVIYSEL